MPLAALFLNVVVPRLTPECTAGHYALLRRIRRSCGVQNEDFKKFIHLDFVKGAVIGVYVSS